MIIISFGKNYLNNYYFNELNFIEEYDDDNDLFNVLRYKNVIIGKYLLSLFYYKDIILDINFKQNELSNLLKLAENDDLEAKYNLAICYKNGKGTKSNYKKAFELFLNLAERENSDAQYNLAVCYMDGIGTQRDGKKAFDWFLKSEKCKNETTQCSEDERLEFEKTLKLAISNNSKAQDHLGCCYRNGTDKDIKKSFEWYLKAAGGGYAIAQNYVGACYYFGIGADSNNDKAIYWYKKALDNGIEEAKDMLKVLLPY
ncbi:unnamed protein product [Rhizophagus irregularis]|nr:unnamed protein product [Rhizophagus irregularis]